MASDVSRLSAAELSLSADLIAQRGFGTSRRGFDPDEVRAFLTQVAKEFRALRQRESALEQALREAEYRAAHPKWDENTLLSAVGEETASILRSAHTAAADIRAKSEENAARILKEAHDQAESMRNDAEAVLGKRTEEADVAAARIREVAGTDGERTREVALQQAEAIRQQTDAERKAMVEAAQTTRERILSDLARKRKVAAVQIEQLRAGRERLLESYRVVRRTLDEVTDELQRADAEARAAAEAVGRREPAPLVQTPPAPVQEAVAPEASPEESPVKDLFARIRADREEAVSHPQQAPAETPPTSHSEDEPQTEPPSEPAVPNPDEAMLQRRDETVGTIEGSLARRLKRVLQDEQNDLLDRLRNVRGKPSADAVLPGRDTHAARFAEAGRPALDQAAKAGHSFVAASAGGQPSEGELPDSNDLADDLAGAVVDPLRRRLEEVFAEGADDDPVVLAESVGAAYREWKTQRIELTAADYVASAFARGAFLATPDGTRLRWIVDDIDGQCPDCDDNALAGGLPKGEMYPTGQPHPPAHPGCRCLLVPEPS